MMCVFFVGIGITAILTSMAGSLFQVGVALFVIGIFAAIYHPVDLAIVSMKWNNTGMRIAMNGVWGNLGVASAALITGYMVDNGGWRMAFILPGVFSTLTGIAYFVLQRDEIRADGAKDKAAKKEAAAPLPADYKALLVRVSAIVFFYDGCILYHLPIHHLRPAENAGRAPARLRWKAGGNARTYSSNRPIRYGENY